MSVDLEEMLKKHPSRILELANKQSLTTASQSLENYEEAKFHFDFANVVKLSEDESAGNTGGMTRDSSRGVHNGRSKQANRKTKTSREKFKLYEKGND